MASSTPPNIVVLMTDQQRAGCTAAEGGPDTMPRLDAQLAGGVRFERAYTSAPACVPARTSLLTGRFPSAHRVRQNSTAEHAYYSQDLLQMLRAAGYSLHFSGKPHMHPGPEDFDTFHGPFLHDGGPDRSGEHAAFDTWLRELDHAVAAEPTPFGVQSQLPSRIVDGAIEAIEAKQPDPYFLWVSIPEPHNPYQVPEPYFSLFDEADVPERLVGPEVLDRMGWRFRWLHRLIEDKRPGFDDQWRRYRANYLGMLRLIDDQIGRLLDHLEQRPGGLENTIVIFLSDHGDFTGDYGLQRKGAGVPEALMRIPLAIAGPDVQAQHRSELVSIVDLLPTLAEWIGAPLPAGVQGRSLTPLLRGEEAPPSEFATMYGEHGYGGVSYGEDDRPPLHFSYDGATFDELNSVTQSGEMRMVVDGRYKLVTDDTGEVALYDLSDDPAETHDLSTDPGHREVRERLLLQLVQWMLRVADDLPEGDYRPRTRAHNWRWA
ncbi:sulfatase-like hydrolase/transferase [Ruania suaedae]|uniref:sulfatase-like hydrolase/transferase n=1 Tax=Ruania suaedae TaxID=2897774 RepID=UPI001E59FD95|nr:sulfatase-like hydrolase/transferase [Ruania suaedae]UFU03087.1 sulfatase-like hydrolase/transferase [Ruania suaedae]